jgi:hypothetical protein
LFYATAAWFDTGSPQPSVMINPIISRRGLVGGLAAGVSLATEYRFIGRLRAETAAKTFLLIHGANAPPINGRSADESLGRSQGYQGTCRAPISVLS